MSFKLLPVLGAVVIALASVLMPGSGVLAQTEDPVIDISGRTAPVRDAILVLIPATSDCASVTASQLSGITGSMEVTLRIAETNDDGETETVTYSLSGGDFNGLKNLESLTVQIYDDEPSDNVFSGLDRLKTLDLSRGSIDILPERIFDDVPLLERLDLSQNGLLELPSDLLDEQSSLKHLVIKGNMFTTLPEDLLEGSAKTLETLELGNEALATLPDDFFKGLTSLSRLRISESSLGEIPWHPDLESIEYVKLSNNLLIGIPEGMLSGVTGLKVVDLSGNPDAPFAIKVDVVVESVGLVAATLRATASEAVPVDTEVRLSATAGTLESSTVTIPRGSQQSELVVLELGDRDSRDTTLRIDEANWPESVNREGGVVILGLELATGEPENVTFNTPATGKPTISGTAQVGSALTVDTSAISDVNGLDDVSYSYQWYSGGTAISGATGSSYTVQTSDEGDRITVTVTFNDDLGFDESATSDATSAVVVGGV